MTSKIYPKYKSIVKAFEKVSSEQKNLHDTLLFLIKLSFLIPSMKSMPP